MDKNILNSMFENLLHIWNKTNFWNPKMKSYIYGSVNGIHVFNLIKTGTELDKLKAELTKYASEGKKVLFVATKLQARDAFAKLAEETGHFYVTEKWIPGLLTNFKTIKRRIATYLKYVKDVETGAMEMLTKKEKATKMLELEKMHKAFAWLKEMKKTPDVVFVVDGAYEAQALREAKTLKIVSLAVLNTNGNPDLVEAFVPANTNSIKSINYIAEELKTVLKSVKSTKAPNEIKKIEVKKQTVKKTEEK